MSNIKFYLLIWKEQQTLERRKQKKENDFNV